MPCLCIKSLIAAANVTAVLYVLQATVLLLRSAAMAAQGRFLIIEGCSIYAGKCII